MKGSVLVEALENFWSAIRQEKSELNDAIITTGFSEQNLGHFCSKGWFVSPDVTKPSIMGEIFISGDILNDPSKTLDVFLHEATHALADSRGINDCNEKNPKYHNKHFKRLAELEFDLSVDRSVSYGYSDTKAPSWQYELYKPYLDKILDLGMWRILEEDNEEKKTPPKQVCGCENPRILRLSNKQKLMGPIICGLCQRQFEDEKEEE